MEKKAEEEPEEILLDEKDELTDTFQDLPPAETDFSQSKKDETPKKNQKEDSKEKPSQAKPTSPGADSSNNQIKRGKIKKEHLALLLILIVFAGGVYLQHKEAQIERPTRTTTTVGAIKTSTTTSLPEESSETDNFTLIIEFTNESSIDECISEIKAEESRFNENIKILPLVATAWIEESIGDRLALQNLSELMKTYNVDLQGINITSSITSCPPQAYSSVEALAKYISHNRISAQMLYDYIDSGDSATERDWELFEKYSSNLREAKEWKKQITLELDATKTTSTTSLPFTTLPTITSSVIITSSTTSIPTDPEDCNDICLIEGYSGGQCRKRLSTCDIKGEVHPSNSRTYCKAEQAKPYCCCWPNSDEGLVSLEDEEE
ncbi:MAG: hypothetical protein ABH950_02850 [Candidatus Altiarchaeota archaeon]